MRTFARAFGLAVALSLGTAAPSVDAAAASGSSTPLPPIPAAQPTALPAPEAEVVTELDALLLRLASADDKERNEGAEALAAQDATILPAIAAKLAALRKSADRAGMERILSAARKAGRDRDDEEDKRKESDSAAEQHQLMEPGGDWLRFVISKPLPNDAAYKDLVAILGMARTCACVGTTSAAREIVNVYMYFGDLFRIDVQRQLARMGDRALPALIEAQYHDSKMVRTWAQRRLDLLGKAIPSEAVRTNDNHALADILRAYGRAREVEAVRVIVSFANSDRLQVRQAAREAIGQVGEPAKWQLKDAYEDLMGTKPDRSWDWRRTAQELFAAYDRARLQEVYAMIDRGLGHYKDGKLDEAIADFDRVLARAPMFERRAEMVPAYIDLANKRQAQDPQAALAALRKAESIDPAGPQVAKIKAQVAVLEAQQLAQKGLMDTALLETALQLDPDNAQARALLEQANLDVEVRESAWKRYAAAAAIGVVALAAMVFVSLAPRRRRPAAAPGDKEAA